MLCILSVANPNYLFDKLFLRNTFAFVGRSRSTTVAVGKNSLITAVGMTALKEVDNKADKHLLLMFIDECNI